MLLQIARVPALVESLSNDLQVTAETPPCFVWHTADDGAGIDLYVIHRSASLDGAPRRTP